VATNVQELMSPKRGGDPFLVTEATPAAQIGEWTADEEVSDEIRVGDNYRRPSFLAMRKNSPVTHA